MPQEFQVLRCFQCSTFQVHQVKKTLKWSCKLCGEKQSVIKVFGRGTGFECRQHVQKLNTLRGEAESTTQHLQREVTLSEDVSQISHDVGRSRWEEFVSNPEAPSQNEGQGQYDDDDDATYTTDASIFLAEKKSRKRKRKSDEEFPRNQKSAKWAEFSLPNEETFEGAAKCRASAAYTTEPENRVTTETGYKKTSSINRFKPSLQPNQGYCQKNETDSDAISTLGNSKWGMFQTDNLSLTQDSSMANRNCKFVNKSSHLSTSTGSSKWSMFGANESQSSESYSGEDNCDYTHRRYDTSVGVAALSSPDPSYPDVPSSSVHEDSYRNMISQSHAANSKMDHDNISRIDASSVSCSSSKWGQFLLNDKENEQLESTNHALVGENMQQKMRHTVTDNVSASTGDTRLTSDSNTGLKFSTGEFNEDDFAL